MPTINIGRALLQGSSIIIVIYSDTHSHATDQADLVGSFLLFSNVSAIIIIIIVVVVVMIVVFVCVFKQANVFGGGHSK